MSDARLVTVIGPVNIAVVKYWGKANVPLNTPTNPSLSVTLHTDDLRTTTTVSASLTYKEDKIFLNGKEDLVEKVRLQNCLREMRVIALRTHAGNKEEIDFWTNAKFVIASVNNFPTAAGLASSASGYATLVAALAKVTKSVEAFPGEFTTIARMGSGSACRSLYGGFVKWEKGGADKDWKDSKAVQVADELHWPEMMSVILVVSAAKKAVGSTDGMQETVKTSKLFKERIDRVADEHIIAIEDAIRKRDFAAFGEITMRDSNQFHALCLDTFPPIFYMDDTSRKIVQVVHALNKHCGKIVAAYTFDAGPNAVIYTTKDHLKLLLEWCLFYFPPGEALSLSESLTLSLAGSPSADIKNLSNSDAIKAPTGALETIGHVNRESGKVSRVILTRPGPGPTDVTSSMAPLLNPLTALPN